MLKQNKEIYSIIESLHDNVVISDHEGIIQWVSPSCMETYGMDTEAFIGKSTFDLERQKIWSPAVAPLVLKSKKQVTIVEETKKGEKLIVTGIPILTPENEIERVISYSFDATYLLELTEQYEGMKNLISRYSEEIRELRGERKRFPGIIAKSEIMNRVLKLIMKVADVETNVLITGESGVGKSLVANVVHQNSVRNQGPFIEINCGSIPDNLLESELFGYEPGAFTGALTSGKIGMIELAHEGTLFLDEIGELPLNLQVKLLKIIQDKVLIRVGGNQRIEVNFRLVAATNKDLKRRVREGLFREDLFYRLNVVPIHIPPLRDRRDDILPLIIHFLEQANAQYGTSKTLSGSVINLLISQDWPGNIRQLQNIIERLVIISDNDLIGPNDLPSEMREDHRLNVGDDTSLKRALENLERRMVRHAYERHKTTVGVAAALSISQSAAARKVKKYVADSL